MGFQSYGFLVTPSELKKALEPFNLVVHNAHVPIDYKETPHDEFLKIYGGFYDSLINGKTDEWFNKIGGECMTALTTDLSAVKFGREHTYNGGQYKLLVDSDKRTGPLPYLAPFTFNTYTVNGKLFVSTRYSFIAYCDTILGFEAVYRKLSKSEQEYYGVSSEKDFDTYGDYILFKKNITSITKAFKFRLNGIEKNTSIRISGEVRNILNEIPLIKNKGIEVI